MSIKCQKLGAREIFFFNEGSFDKALEVFTTYDDADQSPNTGDFIRFRKGR